MLNEGMDPNVELPVPVPVAFQKRFDDARLRYYLSKELGFTALMLATALGNDGFVKILLSAGADPWKVTKRHKTHALWLAAKSRNIEIMRSLMGIGPDHESRAFRITISLSEQYAFLWRNGRFIVATPISSGTRSIPRREDNISLPTNTGIGNRPSIRPRCLSSCGCPAAILASTWAGCLAILASHGCIRLPERSARTLYASVPMGTLVEIQ
jgi:Ankyrin repeats (3 copies)/L,D-transpeptidase catalytic domain